MPQFCIPSFFGGELGEKNEFFLGGLFEGVQFTPIE